ncbi:MAG: hypothetical protein A2Z06_01100 [Candidatus Glassbacteria bacterium RBG_16_58_8]|uniref:PTS EIIA type-4 domain-containing protein n=1 Tax=Candidatus Glassbacteria bacterium RBG_16_58_8 TaxID=1817866 RepID=A0A1F5YBR3_9BACT|nr:MAG: hypothetical protein A2Z06_01100 [Candidatus Glassbacteria bacterium RBG_16_58_8]
MIGAVIVSHGVLANAALEVLSQISGEQKGIVAISNTGRDLRQMEEDLREAIDRLKGHDGVIVFSDLHGGSYSLICKRLLREREGLVLMTGYNLPLLIEFTFYRNRPLGELVPILEEKAKKGIKVFRQVKE